MWSAQEYRVVRGFLSAELRQLLCDYVDMRHRTGTMIMRGDPRIPGTPVLYGDPLTDTLLSERQDAIQSMIGEELWPSYSYVRRHTRGVSMPRHRDRPASEIGVTITVSADAAWPLWFMTAQGATAVTLEPGDAIVYEGGTLEHWREPYPGDLQIQCLLFYVRSTSNEVLKFDGREALGLPRSRRSAAAARAEEQAEEQTAAQA